MTESAIALSVWNCRETYVWYGLALAVEADVERAALPALMVGVEGGLDFGGALCAHAVDEGDGVDFQAFAVALAGGSL